MIRTDFIRRSFPATLALIIVLLAGCGSSPYRQGVSASQSGDYDTALEFLYEAVKEDPGDSRAWREIGLAWYRSGEMDRAEEAFATSNRISPNAMSNLYLGLIFEHRGDLDKAIRVYSAAGRLRGDSRAREMIEDRLGVLIDRRLTREAKMAVASEDSLKARSLPENTIAVINFDGSNLPSDLEPMAEGLAEFIAMDLAKVSELKVLERLKIDVILDELQLSSSSYADVANAPRMGRLLGSSRIVLGTLTSTGDGGFRVDGRLVETAEGRVKGRHSGEGDLERFFEVEKQFVFDLLDTLGVSLSREERDAIQEVPTESFLAFMSYSEGLFFRKRGMYDDAGRAFREAASHDPGFGQAADMAGIMDHAAAYGAGGDGGGPGGAFEAAVAPSLTGGDTGLGTIQAANLVNSGFIMSEELYWDFGSRILAPPGGGPVWQGHGIIIIRGDLDAD